MATPPPNTPPPPPGPSGPFPPGDPRNGQPYMDPREAAADARWRREQERAWRKAQQQQERAWHDGQRHATKQQARAMRQQARLAAEAQRAQLRAMRRSTRAQSLVGPLLLIAFAIAMLLVYSGRISGVWMLAWFGRWWPLLLIAAGLIRLLEWGIARSQANEGTMPVRFSVGAGTVWLLVLLSVVGLAVQSGVHYDGNNNWSFAWTGSDFAQFMGGKHEEDTPAITHTIAADGFLEIDSNRGDVTVTGTSTDNLLHLSLHKEVYATSDERARGLLAELNPQFSGTDQNLTVRVSGADNSNATLTVQAPSGVHVVLNSNRGDVQLNEFQAPVVVTANRGDVNVGTVTGDVKVHLNSRHASVMVHGVRGALDLQGSGDDVNLSGIFGQVRVRGDFFGSGRLQGIDGKVDYDAGRIGFAANRIEGETTFDAKDEFSANGVTGPLVLHTRSRDVSLAHVTGDVHVSNSNGHVSLVSVPPNGAVEIDNRDGDVSVSLPDRARFTVSAETTDGSISNDFPGGSGTTSHSGSGSLSTTVGGGGPLVRIATTHGNIALQKNADVALPTLPALPRLPSRHSLPTDAQAQLREAQQQLQEAQEELRKAHMEGEEEAREGRAEAEKERAMAQKAGESAREQAREQTQQALQQAQKAREQGLKQAQQAREQAREQARKAMADATRALEQARQQMQQQQPPAPPPPPQKPSHE